MSLLETQDRCREAWKNAKNAGARHGPQPRMAVAAWFPYYFVDSHNDSSIKTQPDQALVIDSLAIFLIAHGDDTAQAADIVPKVSNQSDFLVQKPGDASCDVGAPPPVESGPLPTEERGREVGGVDVGGGSPLQGREGGGDVLLLR